MKYWQAIMVGAVCGALPVIHAWAQTLTPAVSPATAWYAVGHVELQAVDAENALTANWQFDRADNGDIRIIKDEQRSSGKTIGTVMSVCEDRALLLNGIAPARTREMAELEQPVLLLQLALKLLARGLPQGPQAQAQHTAVEIADAAHPLRVAKGNNARRDFGAPWHAQIRTSGAGNGDIKFDATLSYDVVGAQKNAEIKLSGTWRQDSAVHAWDNNASLKDYHVYRVGKMVNVVGGNAQIDSGLSPQVFEFDTFGALRAIIERNWDPNPKAPQRLACGL